MKVAAIIAEYNPLHFGHVYHIDSTKKLSNCDAVIGIMSGNFVQRGEPALIDKFMRTRMALKNGIDLIIELPIVYSLASAEFFAFGAVSILNRLGIVDYISFGSEIGNAEVLYEIASVLAKEDTKYKKLFKYHISKGEKFPTARSNSLKEYFENGDLFNKYNNNLDKILNSSNNILGIEYCKALIKLKSNINVITIKRQGGAYNESKLNNIFSSATSIRKYIKSNSKIDVLKNHIPNESYNIINELILSNYSFTYPDDMLKHLKYKAFTDYNRTIKKIPDVSEGLDNKIIDVLQNNNSYETIVKNIKSKRYTYTRISRILCQYFIGFEQFDIDNMRKMETPYARILGFNNKGKYILNKIKKNKDIALITNIPKYHNDFLDLDIQSTKAYSLLNTNIKYNCDYINKPIIIDN